MPDRLLHHVVVIHIDRQSYRLRHLGALLKAPPPPKPGCPDPLTRHHPRGNLPIH